LRTITYLAPAPETEDEMDDRALLTEDETLERAEEAELAAEAADEAAEAAEVVPAPALAPVETVSHQNYSTSKKASLHILAQ
jgi:hypothetical protein